MITKERLEELIKQDATIYIICWGKIKEISLDDVLYMDIEDDQLCYEIEGDLPRTTDLNHLFETHIDAEEYVEFGNITRTDTLKFPIWKDVKDTGYDEIFFVKDKRFDSGIVQYYFLVAEQTKQIQIMFREIEHIMTIDAYDVIFSKPLTQENYNEARRFCVKLFKGEDV